MCRDVDLLHKLIKVNCEFSVDRPSVKDRGSISRTRRLLYPTDQFPVRDGKAQKSYEDFAYALEKTQGYTRVDINLAQLWKEYSEPFTQEPFRDYFALVRCFLL